MRFTLAAAAFLALPVHAQNLLINGSFEDGPTPDNPYAVFNIPAYSSDIVGWTVLGDSIDYIMTAGWQPSDGQRSLDLNGNPGVGGIAQSFLTTPGARYRVRFDLAGNPDGDNGVRTLYASAGDQELNFTFDTAGHTHDSMGWTTISFEFFAIFGETTLSFLSTTTDQHWYGPALDNVSVEPACGPDFNHDGFLDIFDFNDFVTCFEGGACPEGSSADYTLDGFVDIYDFQAFVTDFETGC